MEHSQNQELEYTVDNYYDMTNFDDHQFEDSESLSDSVDDSLDSDFEDDFEQVWHSQN